MRCKAPSHHLFEDTFADLPTVVPSALVVRQSSSPLASPRADGTSLASSNSSTMTCHPGCTVVSKNTSTASDAQLVSVIKALRRPSTMIATRTSRKTWSTSLLSAIVKSRTSYNILSLRTAS